MEDKKNLDEDAESSFLDESIESLGGYMEELLLFDQVVEVPSDLFSDPTLFASVFNLSNFNLPGMKENLMHLLPNFPSQDEEEKLKSLNMLFGGENIAFGNPLQDFRDEVLKGNYSPERRRLREYVKSARARDDNVIRTEYNFRIMNDLLKGRKRLLEETSGGAISVPVGVQKLERQSLRIGTGIRSRCKRRYLEEMKRIKAAVDEEGLSSDDEELFRKCKANDVEIRLVPELKSSNKQTSGGGGGAKENILKTPLRNLDEERMRLSLTQDCHQSYFHLLNDLFLLGTDNRLTLGELDNALTVWQESPIAALNSWYHLCSEPGGWKSLVPSALGFLSGAFPDQVPSGFAPCIVLNEALGCYQWIDDSVENCLSSLLDWWWERREACQAGLSPPAATASADQLTDEETWHQQTSWRVRPSTPQEREEYQRQESKRYANPSQPFRWVMHDYSVCVGRVKGSLSVKSKNHAMLKPGRPAFVTVLTLVRDAVSRLPNGEGSRSDIIELLKDSQFLNSDLDMTSLTLTVSGALDRLQNETDSCVKYDNVRKIWIYLHRDKTLEELDNLFVKSKAKQRNKKNIKLDDIDNSAKMSAKKKNSLVAAAFGRELSFSSSILNKKSSKGSPQSSSTNSSMDTITFSTSPRFSADIGSPTKNSQMTSSEMDKKAVRKGPIGVQSCPSSNAATVTNSGGDRSVFRPTAADGRNVQLSPSTMHSIL